jgi:hypothetical protein
VKKTLSKLLGWIRGDGLSIPEYISNDDLTPEMVPAERAPWHEIVLFSLTFNVYQKAGSFNACTEVRDTRDCTTLTEMRAFLYYEQRRWIGLGKNPDEKGMDFIRELLARIREKIENEERV